MFGDEKKDAKDEKKGDELLSDPEEKKKKENERSTTQVVDLFCFDEGRIDPFRTTVLP